MYVAGGRSVCSGEMEVEDLGKEIEDLKKKLAEAEA